MRSGAKVEPPETITIVLHFNGLTVYAGDVQVSAFSDLHGAALAASILQSVGVPCEIVTLDERDFWEKIRDQQGSYPYLAPVLFPPSLAVLRAEHARWLREGKVQHLRSLERSAAELRQELGEEADVPATTEHHA